MKTNALTGTATILTPPHRRMNWPAGLVLLLAFATDVAQSQSFTNFNSGSTGEVPLIVTANTNIALPPDGILHYSTITINSGAIVTFTPNALNTPVYLLARSNVLINGTIDVTGEAGSSFAPGPGAGGPGGFRGGFGMAVANPPVPSGDGKGPGGGRGGNNNNGAGGAFSYGNVLCAPLIGGSGGGGGGSYNGAQGGAGGGGGGAILIASGNWITNNGIIKASGGGGGGNSFAVWIGGTGSGGAIRLVAPMVSGSGNGSLNASGGRMRIDSADGAAGLRIQMSAGAVSATRGSQAFVFPQTNLLTIANVTIGAQSWVLNPSNSITIPLAAGPAVSALVQIVASGSFYSNSIVPIAVVVTPDQGATTYYTNAIYISNNAGFTNVTVTIPTGTTSSLHVWTIK